MASEVPVAGADLPRRVAELERKLSDAHRREGATAEVLKAISRSTFNLQEVLDRLIESAVQLTGAETGLIIRQDGEVYRAAAIYGASPEFVEVAKQNPIPQGRQSATGRAVLERRIIHIHDVFDDPEYTWVGREAAGVRTILAVPMLREEIVVGVIGCGRREVRPFTAKQIELVQTFADQAVIAIENTRLFEEVQAKTRDLSEALEHQTATSEVLQVINRSPGDLRPVFGAILDKATRLCQAPCGILWTYDGERLHASAHRVPPAFAEFLRAPLPGDASPALMRIVRGGPGRQFADHLTSDDYRAGNPLRRATVDLGGARTVLSVPIRKDANLLGIFVLYRQEVRLFTDKQIELIKSFADQAVIAIENTRLFEAEQASKRELQASLEYQTATSEVLSVISRSPTDAQPVFDAIAESARRLGVGYRSAVYRFDGTLIHHIAHDNWTREGLEALHSVYPRPPSRETQIAQAILEATVVHVPDVEVSGVHKQSLILARALG
jgi:two-component system, NtrC family, sensor kinase